MIKVFEIAVAYIHLQTGKIPDTANNDTNEKVSNGVTTKENNGDTRPEKENKEQREKRSSSNQTHQ